MALTVNEMSEFIIKALREEQFNPNDEYSRRFIRAIAKGIIQEFVAHSEVYTDERKISRVR